MDLHATQRAAHDEPHEQLHTLRARFAYKIRNRQGREEFRILDDFVDAHPVELFIDEAGPRTVQLVRKTTCSDDDNPLILRKDSSARPIACPSLKQRAGVARGI